MNRKENEQLKKIEQLDKQLDHTINKIGVAKVESVKISKKKLALFMLIPFSLACVLTAVTSFLIIDPFHWYTKSRLSLEQKQEKTIKQIKQKFADLSLATALDSSKTIADLLWEAKLHPSINEIIQSPNEIIDITSKKSNESKLSSTGEDVNIKILVRTGSLEKEIDVKLKIIIDNKTVKQVNGLVKYSQFLDSIVSKIAADGKKRVSNLVNVIKTIINENDVYRVVFKGIKFDIVNDKNDDEIIASGLKTLNINFNFTENNKLINSSVKLNVNLQGKNRKEINEYLARLLDLDKLIFVSNGDGSYDFTVQPILEDKLTYKELIDELISTASKNNFYFSTDVFKGFDNSDSKISIDFTIANKNSEEFNESISISNGKAWEIVSLKLTFSVGNGQDKFRANAVTDSFDVLVMKEDYVQKEFFMYISKFREVIAQAMFKYELKAEIGKTYGELSVEIKREIDRLTKDIVKPNEKHGFWYHLSHHQGSQDDSIVIAENDNFYTTRIYFDFNNWEISDSPKIRPLWLNIPIKR